MKNLLNIIAALIILIWIIVFQPAEYIHLLLLLAGVIILITQIFDKQLSRKRNT